MARETELGFKINRVLGKDDQWGKIVKETEAFYDKLESNPAEIHIGDAKEIVDQLKQVRLEYNKINNDTKSNRGQIEFADLLCSILDKAKGKFDNIGVMFKNVNNNSQKYVTGLFDIMQHFDDSDFGVRFLDIGAQFGELQDRANELFNSLKEMDTVAFGRFLPDNTSLNTSELQECLDILRELNGVIGRMADINPNMKGSEFVGGLSPEHLKNVISEASNDLNEMRRLRLDTTEELRKYREIIDNATSGVTWDEWEHDNAKAQIDDDEEYENAIENIQRYIDVRRKAIEQLQQHEYDLFAADDISEYIEIANQEIDRLVSMQKELQDLRGAGKSDTSIVGDFSEVVSALSEIKDAIREIKEAFDPLTQAFANEESAIHAMVTSNVSQLEELINKFKEVHDMVDSLNSKDFNITNVITQKGNTNEAVRAVKNQAKTLLDVVKQLVDAQNGVYRANNATYQTANRQSNGLVMASLFELQNLDVEDLTKKIAKSGSEAKLFEHMSTLEYYKDTVLKIINELNKVSPGVIDTDSILSKLNSAQKTLDSSMQIPQVSTQENEIKDFADRVIAERKQIDSELGLIRQKIEETFDFSTINPDLSNVQSITNNIYEQFEELQNKIKALDFNIEAPNIEGVVSAIQVINQEGEAADSATPKKNAFTEANEKVAESMKETGDVGKAAADGVIAEADAVNGAYKSVANFSFKKNSSIDDIDFEDFADAIAANNNLKVKQAKAIRGELDGLIGGSITFQDPKTLQEIQERYSVRPKANAKDEMELYRASYTIIENVAKAEKQAANEAERRNTAIANSNKWLIEQESLLVSQENKYKASSGAAKPLDGTTGLIDTSSGVLPGFDKTIDGLADSIRSRINDSMGGIITQDLKNEIIKDLNTLKNEIQVQQARQYQSTTLRASSLETSRDVYRQHIDALESDSRKAGIYDQMENTVADLKEEVESFTEDSFATFLENVKKAQAKFKAEKSKFGQKTKEQKQEEQAYNKLIQLQNKLYDAKKKLATQEYGSVEEQEWQRKVDEAQKEYNFDLQSIQNSTKKADVIKRESQLQSELSAVINERIKKEEELAWAQRGQEENSRIEQEIEHSYKERADAIKLEANAEKELAIARKEAYVFYQQEEKTKKAQEDAAWAEYRAEQEVAAEKERQINLAFSAKEAKEAAEAERELAQARKEANAYFDAVEKQEKKEEDTKKARELNALYRERNTIITAIVKYNNKANTLKTDKAIQRAKEELEVQKERLATIDDEIHKYGELINKDKLKQQNDRLINRLRDSNVTGAISKEQKQDIEDVNRLLTRRKEVHDHILKLQKQLNDAKGNEERKTIQKELDGQNAIYRTLTKQLTAYKDISLQRRVTEQDNGFREQDSWNKIQSNIDSAADADKLEQEDQKQNYKDILSLVEQLFDAQTALHKINTDSTGKVHAAERKQEIAQVKELSMLLKDIYGIDVKNLMGSLDKNVLLTQEQKNELLEKERDYRKDIVALSAKAADQAADVIRKETERKQEKAVSEKQKYGQADYSRLNKFSESVHASIRELQSGGSVSTTLSELVAEFDAAYNKIDLMRKQFNEDPASVTDGVKMQFQDSVRHADGLRKKIIDILKESQKLQKLGDLIAVGPDDVSRIEDLKHAMIEFVNSALDGEVVVNGFNKEGTQLYATLNDGSGALKNITVALDGAEGRLKAFTTGTSNATNEWDRFKTQVASGVKNIVGMYVGFQEGVQAARTGVNYVKEIDLALTELKKVTDETDESYRKFLDDAGKTSAVIGSTISDFTNASAAFARLGYSIEEASSMAETAIIYKNVADGLDSVEESSDSIISTMMAFGIEAKDTMSIVDRFNAVGNSFAITSAGIGDALQRSASALYSAGNTIDESVALVTAANSVIQNPEQVGTALKTLALRLRGAKVELEDAGLETDAMAESTSQLQAKLKALTHGKVDIMLDADTFKSTTQILREMSQAWEDMTDIERASALELMGGKRQANILSSVITNFETVEDVITTSMNSAGSAIAENEKWLDSIEGKTYQFTNALQTLWNNMLDSEIIKGFLDFGTGAVQLFDTLEGKTIALVTAYRLLSKSKGFNLSGIFKGIEQSVQQINSATQILNNLKTIDTTNGVFEVSDISAYAAAVSQLTPKLQAQALASNGLSDAQIRNALALNGVDEANTRVAMSQLSLNKTTQQSVSIKGQEAIAILAAKNVKLSDAATSFLQAHATEEVTKEVLKNAVADRILTSAEAAQIAVSLGLTGTNYGLAESFKAIGRSISFMFKSNPVGFFLSILTTVLSLIPVFKTFAGSIEDVAEKSDKAISAYREAKETLALNKSTIEDISEEYEQLSAGVDRFGNNINLTTDEYARYNEIVNEIASMFPQMVSGYTAEGNAILSTKGNVEALTEAYEKQAEAARNAVILGGDDVFADAKDKLEDAKNQVDAYNVAIKMANGLTVTSAKEQYGGVVYDAIDVLKEYGFKENSHTYASGRVAKTYGLPTHWNNRTQQYENGYTYEEEATHAERINKLMLGRNDLLSQQQTYLGKVNTVLQAYLENNATYAKMEEEAQSAISSIVSALDPADFNYDDDAMEAFILSSIIAPMHENKDGVQDALNSLLTIDENETSYQMYESLRSALLTAIASLPAKTQDAIKKAFGLDGDSEYGTYLNHAKEILQDDFDDMASELALSDLKLLDKLDIPDGTLLTWEELKQKIAEVKSTLSSDIVAVQTYSTLAESAAAYNDILAQTSEIVTDNTEVTQEYKDALANLGISAEELNECFDDQNPLIVKNAKALTKLVKAASKNVAANVKIAKSQARLEYYQLVKQLGATLDGTRRLDDATRDSIYSTIEQIDTVEHAIYKYQLLEDSLLGATNAFTDFAKAQEIDELNTYGDSYVEMVQTLYDGLYKTGQVGTEQFKAAAEALIPDDVYQGLVDEHERMEAILEYFNKNIAPTLNLNEDEFEFDFESIDNFVDKAREAKVLIGENNENFDLAEGMNLEKAAELMGMTTTQAYAFFAELDKYNTGSEQSFLAQLDDSLEGKISNVTTELQDLNKQKLVFLEDRTEIAEALEELGAGGSVDLTNRPVINSQELIDAGWKTQAGQIATVFTSTFSNEAGNVAINFTPIMTDDLGNRIGVLSPEELQAYAEAVIDGAEDVKGLQIGAKFEGENAIAEAEAAAEHIHNLHEDYIGLDKTINEINADIAKNQGELNNVGKSAYEMWQSYTKNEAALAALDLVADKQRLLTQDEANKLGIEWDASKELTVQQAYDSLLAKQQKLEEPTVLTAQLSIEYINQQIAEIQSKINTVKHDSTISPEVKKANIAELEAQIKELKENKVVIATEFGIELSDEEKATVKEELNGIEQFTIHDKEFTVIVNGTSDVMQKLQDIRDYSLGNKTVNVTTYDTTYKRTKKQKWNPVTLTWDAEADGTAHANGSWGAPKTETALVGELGPEMLVRNGRWTTVGDNGAEFTQVKKGDIIFNHKQTEDLLSKGYVTGRGKLHGGAFASGTAYAGLWKPISPNKAQSNKPGREFSYAASDLDNAAGSISDAADEFREVFDWIEVRLEEINEDISLKSAELENEIGYQEQNKVIDKMIDLNQKLYDNLITGANRYYAYAESLLAKIPAEYRQAAQDGTIAIEEFVGKTDEKTLEAIQEYREWVQKSADLTQQAEETLTEISALAKQAIDNIASEFENKASLNGSVIEQLEAYNSLLETDKGFESEGIYQKLIEANNANIEQLKQQRDAMQAELNEQVKAGNIQVGSQDWYDAVNDIAAVDTEIIELTTDTENYQDAINELHWDKFDALMSRLESVSEEAENLIDILGNKDLVDEAGNWTDEGITSLGLYAQQMETAEVQAKKYQEEIDYLNKNWQALGYTEQEYIEKLDELKDGQYDAIKAYHDSKDAIVDLNKERIDAIKKGIEKEIEAYEELIKIKKEELDSEKDLYDFQKSAAEKQKNIDDIRRKLDALSGDNSASARAKRAQLEADLAEALAEQEELYYDRSIQDQQDVLDKELENFQEAKDKEMEGWDEYLENTEQVVSDSLSMVQANTDAVYQTLLAMGEEYGLSVTESLTSPWKYGELAIQSFSEQFGISMSSTVEELEKLALEFKETMDAIKQAGIDATNVVTENAQNYTKEKNPAKESSDSSSNNNNGSSSNAAPSTAGLVSSISGTIYQGQTGDRVKKLQQALNELGYGNYGTTGLDGIFGSGTLAAVKAFQRAMGLETDGRVGPKTKEKFKLKGYAKGSKGLDKDQLALIDELGEELELIPDGRGRLSYMKKGTGIIPADLTANLMGWGKLDPSIMLDQNRPQIGVSPSVINNTTEIHIDASVGELLHVEHLDGNNPAEITKIVDKAWDKRMKELNAHVRRYVR